MRFIFTCEINSEVEQQLTTASMCLLIKSKDKNRDPQRCKTSGM